MKIRCKCNINKEGDPVGRNKKEVQKRISGSGYNAIQAGSLKYKKKQSDGTYDIDYEAIKAKIADYIASCKDSEGNYIKPISRQSLYKILDIDNNTYALWLQGYTSRDHIDSEEWEYNQKLKDALRTGNNEVLIYLVENSDKYTTTKDIRLLETYGELSPQKQQIEAKFDINLGKHKRFAK